MPFQLNTVSIKVQDSRVRLFKRVQKKNLGDGRESHGGKEMMIPLHLARCLVLCVPDTPYLYTQLTIRSWNLDLVLS